MKLPVLIASFIAMLVFAHSASARTWTSADGSTVEAELISTTETHVTIRREADGKTFTIPWDKLSVEDREWVAANLEETEATMALPKAAGELVETRGTLIFQDDFNREDADDKDDLGPDWTTNSKSRAQGDKQNDLADGALEMTISPRANHAISTKHHIEEPWRDVVVYLRMKLDEGDQLKLAYNDLSDKSVWAGHINGVTISPNKLTLTDERESRFKLTLRDNQETPAGKEAMAAALAKAEKSFPLELETGVWHDVVTVHLGETLTVYIDGEEVGAHSSPGFAHPTKHQFVFAVPKHAVVDDLKIWELGPAAE